MDDLKPAADAAAAPEGEDACSYCMRIFGDNQKYLLHEMGEAMMRHNNAIVEPIFADDVIKAELTPEDISFFGRGKDVFGEGAMQGNWEVVFQGYADSGGTNGPFQSEAPNSSAFAAALDAEHVPDDLRQRVAYKFIPFVLWAWERQLDRYKSVIDRCGKTESSDAAMAALAAARDATEAIARLAYPALGLCLLPADEEGIESRYLPLRHFLDSFPPRVQSASATVDAHCRHCHQDIDIKFKAISAPTSKSLPYTAHNIRTPIKHRSTSDFHSLSLARLLRRNQIV